MEKAEDMTAHEWVGKSVIDREGVTLGTCTARVEDSRGHGSWMAVKGAGVSGWLPADDAAESSGQVKAKVTRAQVVAAPPAAFPDRLSEFEEAALRRHYGRAAQQPGSSGPDPVKLGLAGAGLVALVVVWVVARMRRRQPTPQERLAAARRTASDALAHRAKELATTAAPVAGEVSHLAMRGAHAGVEIAGRTVAAAAPVALTAAGAAAHGVSDLASGAGELASKAADTGHRLTGAVAETLAEVPETVADQVDHLQRTWRKVTNRLTFAVFLGLGYVLGARAGRERYDDIVGAASRLTGQATDRATSRATGRDPGGDTGRGSSGPAETGFGNPTPGSTGTGFPTGTPSTTPGSQQTMG